MSRCSNCNREFPDGGAFCPYCGTPNAQLHVNPKPSNNRVKIALIIAIAAVAVAAMILTGIIIVNNNTKPPQNTPVPAASTGSTAAATVPAETSAPATTVAPTTKPPTTTPPTTAPPTTAAPTTAAPVTAPPGKQTYHNTQYSWSVDIPDEWYEYGIVIEEESTTEDYFCPLRFMYKEAYESIHAGHVFTIYAVPANSSKDDGQTGGNPAGGFLGRNSQYAFYWWKATDVQFDSNGSDRQRQSEEYKTLSDMRQTILDSFKLD